MVEHSPACAARAEEKKAEGYVDVSLPPPPSYAAVCPTRVEAVAPPTVRGATTSKPDSKPKEHEGAVEEGSQRSGREGVDLIDFKTPEGAAVLDVLERHVVKRPRSRPIGVA